MAVIERVSEQGEVLNLHEGKGKGLAHIFFSKELGSSLLFFDLELEPGAYAGHHRHSDNVEILYILSGRAENFQDGKRQVLEAGDAILTRTGESHAIKNIGEEVLYILGFGAGDIGAIDNLPLPELL
ncbi:MAG: cupin domain-containing protein, partial [Anaerolineae bacterium]